MTVTVKPDVPFAVGVPETTPVAGVSVSPAGRLPELIDHVYPGVPPPASKVCEYATPLVPEASTEEAIESGVGETTIEVAPDAVCAGLPESVTLTVKLDVPLAVGVPEIAPVEGLRERPLGN